MKCIVLSGATVPFNSLVAAINPELVRALNRFGYDEIEVQYGHAESAFQPQNGVTGFDLDVNIVSRIHEAQLVITHAGAGSILDSLDRGGRGHIAKRKVLVVVNDTLMDNHQLELAQKLDDEGNVLLVPSPLYILMYFYKAMERNFSGFPEPSSIQLIVDNELSKSSSSFLSR